MSSASSPARPGAARALLAAAVVARAVFAVAALLVLPRHASGQLRRAAAVPYAPAEAGRLLVGAGAGRDAGASFPLSGLEGDLARLGALAASYSYASGAVAYVRGDALRVLSVEERGPSAVPLGPDVDDGTTRDAGDVRLGTLFRLAGGARGLSGGLHLDLTVPSSDERKGIGTNTTDVAASLFGSWGRGPVRLTGDVGVAILEAPVDPFVQNDVVVYAAEALWRAPSGPVRLSVSASGRASTRGTVPTGTGDRGRVWARAELLSGPWRLDGGVGAGYAGSSPDWALEAGVARVIAP